MPLGHFNRRFTGKAVRDGIADCFGRGDGAKSGLTFRYGQRKGREHAVVVEVEAAT